MNYVSTENLRSRVTSKPIWNITSTQHVINASIRDFQPRENTYVEIPFLIEEGRGDHATRRNSQEGALKANIRNVKLDLSTGYMSILVVLTDHISYYTAD